MSIVTLARKTHAKYNNMSCNAGPLGFSINGTQRNLGYIGQTSSSRDTETRTTNRGGNGQDGNRGHGGCCGTYPNNGNAPFIMGTGTWTTRDIAHPIIIPSSVSSRSQIRTQNAWIWRPMPHTSVKPKSTVAVSCKAGEDSCAQLDINADASKPSKKLRVAADYETYIYRKTAAAIADAPVLQTRNKSCNLPPPN
jgi:hypothetical protein